MRRGQSGDTAVTARGVPFLPMLPMNRGHPWQAESPLVERSRHLYTCQVEHAALEEELKCAGVQAPPRGEGQSLWGPAVLSAGHTARVH